MSAMPLLLLLAAAFAAVLAQSALDLTRWLCGAQLNLLPALMVYAALTCKLPALMALALVAGLLFDSMSANPLGTMALALFLPAWLIHRQRALILRDLPFARLVLGLAATGATPIIAVLLLLSARHEVVLGWFSVGQWVVLTLIGGLLTPLLFELLEGARQALTYQRAPSTTFRSDREIRRRRRRL